MKIKSIMIMVLATVAITSQAQKPTHVVWQAFDEFYNDVANADGITSSSTNTYRNGRDRIFSFALSNKGMKNVNKLNNALTGNSKLAYRTFMQRAGTMTDNKPLVVAYGVDNENRVSFGTYKDYNYNVIVTNDLKDSTMRYVYALAWRNRNDSVIGDAYQIYGKKPEGGWNDKTPNSSWRDTEDGMEDYSAKFNKKLKIKDSDDFISQFNNLHVLYSKLNDTYKDYKTCEGDERAKMLNTMNLMVGTLNRVNDMCSNYYNVINDQMKQFVADQLNEMGKESKIGYIGRAFKAIANELVSQ